MQNFNLIQRPIPQRAPNGVPDQAPVLPPKHQQPPPYRPAPPPPSSQLLMPPIAEDNVYLNGDGVGGSGGGATFHLGTAVGGPAGAAGKFFSMAPPMGTACSSEGSHDSHNDSGYCTRPGGGSISGGPSPSLSGNTRKFVI